MRIMMACLVFGHRYFAMNKRNMLIVLLVLLGLAVMLIFHDRRPGWSGVLNGTIVAITALAVAVIRSGKRKS